MCLKQPQGQGLIHRHRPCVCFQVFCCLHNRTGKTSKFCLDEEEAKPWKMPASKTGRDRFNQGLKKLEDVAGPFEDAWWEPGLHWVTDAPVIVSQSQLYYVLHKMWGFQCPSLAFVQNSWPWLVNRDCSGADSAAAVGYCRAHASFRTMPAASFAEYVLLERLLLLIRACTARDGIHPIHKRL